MIFEVFINTDNNPEHSSNSSCLHLKVKMKVTSFHKHNFYRHQLPAQNNCLIQKKKAVLYHKNNYSNNVKRCINWHLGGRQKIQNIITKVL